MPSNASLFDLLVVDKLQTRAELLPMSVPGLVDEELPAPLQSRCSELPQIRDAFRRGSALRLPNHLQQTLIGSGVW
jgi:hypothetical protein